MFYHLILENETGQESDGEVVGGGREGDSQRQREIGVGCGVEIDKKSGRGEEEGCDDFEGQGEVFGLFHASISIL